MTVSAKSASAARPDQSGFIYVMDKAAARRQLHLSLLVIVALVVAIASAALNVRTTTPAHQDDTAFLKMRLMPLKGAIGSQG